jgi:hypothetical protein
VKTVFKIIDSLLQEIHSDLSRPHPFATERVGFLTCGIAQVAEEALVLLASRWHPVVDEDYVDDPKAGATIGPVAFRRILQYGYNTPVSIFHVHRHEHSGRPAFSTTDVRSAQEYVPGFLNVRRSHPHGAIVLSHDQATGHVWVPGHCIRQPIERFQVVGPRLRSWP